MDVIDFLNERAKKSRQRIILNYDEVTPENVIEILQKAIPIYQNNKRDCDYLINYFLGDQDILGRKDTTTSSINNKTVVNYAFPITREIVGYTFSNGIELVQKSSDKKDDIDKLSNIYADATAFYTDICTGLYASICGFSYQLTLPSSDIKQDYIPDSPISYMAIDPRNAFIVNSSRVGQPKLLSCIVTKNDKNTVYEVYTSKYKFIIKNMDADTMVTETNPIGINPLTMVENSLFLTGDWEQAIDVLNAINQVTSDALNDIEGTIKSLLVVIGAEFDDSDTTGTDIKKVKDNRLLTLTSNTGGNLDAKFIAPQLDSISVQNIRQYLEDAKNVITGIPDRSANSSGGDTGTAVLNRDGWTDINIVAKLKELFFKKAKIEQITIGLKILQMLGLITSDLKAKDIEVTIGRNNTDNLATKTSAFSTLVATGELATIDCLELSGLTNKTREIVDRGEKFRTERLAEDKETEQSNQSPSNSSEV